MKGAIYRRTHRDEVAAEICERAMGNRSALLALGRATTDSETIIAQVFRWNFLNPTGGWAVICPYVDEIERYDVPNQFRDVLGKYIYLMSEKHFGAMWSTTWHAIWRDRNLVGHLGKGACRADVPVVGTRGLSGEASNPCDCDILLQDVLFGTPYREFDANGKPVAPTQGLVLKLNRMAVRKPANVRAETWKVALKSVLKDKRIAWAKVAGGATDPGAWVKKFGITDPVNAQLLVSLGKEAGYVEPRRFSSLREKLIDETIRPVLGADADARACQREFNRRVRWLQARCGEEWFEEHILANLKIRNYRAQDIPLEDRRGDEEDGSRTNADEIRDPSAIDPGEDAPVDMSVLLKDAFFAQMDTRPTESPRNLMHRALLHVEREIEEAGFAHSVWSDAKKESLLTLAREWWTQGQEQARQLGLER